MKKQITTVRLPENIIITLDERAKEEGSDRTTVIREFLEEAIRTWRIEEAAKLYKGGRVSLSEAANKANLHVGEMMDELVKRGVKSDLTIEEYKESLTATYKVFGLKKRRYPHPESA